MSRRTLLKGVVAAIGYTALPSIVFSQGKEKEVLFHYNRYYPGKDSLTIYSDETWKSISWLGVGRIQTGVIDNGKFVVTRTIYSGNYTSFL